MDFNLNFDLGLAASHSKTPVLDITQVYDLLIIGAGPAGLNAALYAKRKGLTVGIITQSLGGQILDTSSVENYLGFTSLSGEDLANAFIKHISSIEIPILEGVKVVALHPASSGPHLLTLDSGKTLTYRSLIIATGSTPRPLAVPGEKEYLGKGVAYCAICDGPLYIGKTVVVAGGGNSAIEAALDLSKIVEKVYVVHRSQLRADHILVERINQQQNIEILLETKIIEVIGEKKVIGVAIQGKSQTEPYTLSTDGIFVEIGYLPNSDSFKNIIQTNSRGEICIDALCQTNVPGIFAAGDVTEIPFKQIVIAASEGAKAALAVNDFLNRQT